MTPTEGKAMYTEQEAANAIAAFMKIVSEVADNLERGGATVADVTRAHVDGKVIERIGRVIAGADVVEEKRLGFEDLTAVCLGERVIALKDAHRLHKTLVALGDKVSFSDLQLGNGLAHVLEIRMPEDDQYHFITCIRTSNAKPIHLCWNQLTF